MKSKRPPFYNQYNITLYLIYQDWNWPTKDLNIRPLRLNHSTNLATGATHLIDPTKKYQSLSFLDLNISFSACVDKESYCQRWAKSGFCTKNQTKEIMVKNCKLSCNLCRKHIFIFIIFFNYTKIWAWYWLIPLITGKVEQFDKPILNRIMHLKHTKNTLYRYLLAQRMLQ